VGEAEDATQDKVTIQEAARRLGVKEDAIRKRIQRGSMRHEKAEDGRVYVWVEAAWDTGRTAQDATQDTAQDTSQDERLEDLREQVGYLRRQLDDEREARRRADTIIAQLARATEEQARTIRELEAPQEASEDAETVEEAPDRAEAQDELGAERARRETAESTLHEGMSEERRRREEAERERDELRRELYARREPRQSPGTVEEPPDRVETRSATGEAQEGTQRPRSRPWWRRIIGG
jgi:excisionase family DNA binding protein